MTAEQAQHQADLLIELSHDDRESDGPYGPGETARVTAAAIEALSREAE